MSTHLEGSGQKVAVNQLGTPEMEPINELIPPRAEVKPESPAKKPKPKKTKPETQD